MKGIKELRRHERNRLRGQIEISWGDIGSKIYSITGNCLDVSLYGMLVESPSAITPGTKVRAKLQQSDMRGEAVVQHCRQHGPWFRVGLKFDGALLMQETVPNIEKPLLR